MDCDHVSVIFYFSRKAVCEPHKMTYDIRLVWVWRSAKDVLTWLGQDYR
jgi:hypothetical protein